MIFASIYFLFFFCPIALLVYYICPDFKAFKVVRLRNTVLMALSLIFYSIGSSGHIVLLLCFVIINFILGQCIEKAIRKKVVCILGVSINLFLLGVYKYLNFGIIVASHIFHFTPVFYEIALPLGISFITFQCVSYLIDIYSNRVEPQRNVIDFALYVSFFPQLIAGPIVRYTDIEWQLDKRAFDITSISIGVKRFIIGFGKKVIIANNLALLADRVFSETSNPETHSLLFFWIGAIAYTLQIYFDFSGYSDMAIGLGRFFGFHYPENFNIPYMSHSVAEFWTRWHISLGKWFRDYVYIPLGGSRKGMVCTIRNLLVVWMLTGIWHGADYNFLIWGGVNGIVVCLEKIITYLNSKKIFNQKRQNASSMAQKAMRLILITAYINFQWIIFRVENIRDMGVFLGITSNWNLNKITIPEIIYIFREYGVYLVLGILVSFIVPVILTYICECMKNRDEKICSTGNYRIKIFNSLKELIDCAWYMLILLWAMSFLILGTHNPFIYWNF